MAISKFRDDKVNTKYNDVIDEASDDTLMIFLRKLTEKIDEGLDETNQHITKVASFTSDILSNTSKINTNTSNITSVTTKANTNASNIVKSNNQQTVNTRSIANINAGTLQLGKDLTLGISYASKTRQLRFTVTEGKNSYRTTLQLK
tara:strand:+ start:57 stop:497 length:441 start_codon:yes stop_codon:yes gene_type:complete